MQEDLDDLHLPDVWKPIQMCKSLCVNDVVCIACVCMGMWQTAMQINGKTTKQSNR